MTQNVRALRLPMTSITSAGVYMLAAEHATALEKLASDATFAELLGIPHPARAGAGIEAVEHAMARRTDGTAHWSVVVDHADVKGVSAVLDPYGTEPRILVWIDPAARRHGYGSLALRLALDLAFRNFQRERVRVLSDAGDVATERTLAPFGFTPAGHDPDAPNVIRSTLTRAAWIAARDRPALAKLHPDLRTILDAELAAGNEIAETGGGWPDADSVFVRLRDPFRTKPTTLPSGIVYTEPNDPHWWKADYTSGGPRHMLAC